MLKPGICVSLAERSSLRSLSRKGADIMSVQEVIALFALVAYIVIECLKLGLEWVKFWITVGNKNAK